MKKVITYFAVLAVTLCCMVAAYFCQFYYYRYKNTVIELEGRVQSFDQRLGTLEGHKSRELTPVTAWVEISTPDQPPDEVLDFGRPPNKSSKQYYEVSNSKMGVLVWPELRLPANATTNCVYDIQVNDQFGRVADAWLSHAEPYDALAKFEELQVYSPNKTNIVRLVARPKPGASIKLRFDIVVLCEK